MTKFKPCLRCKKTKEPVNINWLSGSSPDDFCFACKKEMLETFVKGLGYKPIDVYQHFLKEEN